MIFRCLHATWLRAVCVAAPGIVFCLTSSVFGQTTEGANIAPPEAINDGFSNCGFNVIEVVSTILATQQDPGIDVRGYLLQSYPLSYELSLLEIQNILRLFGVRVDAYRYKTLEDLKVLLTADRVAVLYGTAGALRGHHFVARKCNGRIHILDFPRPVSILNDVGPNVVHGFDLKEYALICSRDSVNPTDRKLEVPHWHPLPTVPGDGEQKIQKRKVGLFLVPDYAEATIDPSDSDQLLCQFDISSGKRSLTAGIIRGNCGCFKEAKSSLVVNRGENSVIAVQGVFDRYKFNPTSSVALAVEVKEKDGASHVLEVPVIWKRHSSNTRPIVVPEVLVFPKNEGNKVSREISIYFPIESEDKREIPILLCSSLLFQNLPSRHEIVIGSIQYNKHTFSVRYKDDVDVPDATEIKIMSTGRLIGTIPVRKEAWF